MCKRLDEMPQVHLMVCRFLTELVLRVLRFCDECHSMWPCCSCHWWWTDQQWKLVSGQRLASAVSRSLYPLESREGRLCGIHLHTADRAEGAPPADKQWRILCLCLQSYVCVWRGVTITCRGENALPSLCFWLILTLLIKVHKSWTLHE